jgi:DNA-binding NarL/FixJ family response regulator
MQGIHLEREVTMTVKILLVDDHEIVLEGIRNLVGRSNRPWEICGEASNGEEAVSMVKSLRPDLVVLDVTMPTMNGLDAARRIAALENKPKILMFTMHESGRMEIEARDAGAQGFVLKSEAARDLIRAIDTLLEGKTFFGTPQETESTAEPKRKFGLLCAMAPSFA